MRERRDRSSRRGSAGLDQPYLPRRSALPRPTYEPDAFGKVAERIARFIGTARFLVLQSIVVIVWVVYNIAAPKSLRFDNYPFIFLTLALSLQAAYAAPLILLAQNRQDDRDRANLSQDRDQNTRQREDTEYLAREMAALRMTLGEVPTRDFLRNELRGMLAELDDRSPDGQERRERSRRRRSDPTADPSPGLTRAEVRNRRLRN